MEKLFRYYDKLFNELVKLFNQRPDAADFFFFFGWVGVNIITVVVIGTVVNVAEFPS